MAGEIKLNNVSIATENAGTVTINNATLGNSMVLGTNASPIANNLVFANGNGIDFSAAAGSAAGSSSALLDDYEEGSISGADFKVNGTSFTNIDVGNSKYIKVGNLVNVSVSFLDYNVTLPDTGAFTMDLPFASPSARFSVAPVIMYTSAGTWDSAVGYPTGMVVSLGATNTLSFYPTENFNNKLEVTATGTGEMLLSFSITYPSI